MICKPDEPIFKDKRWSIRVVTGTPVYFYIDGPYDGIDDGLLDKFFNWELYTKEFIYIFGDYEGLPEPLKKHTVFKQSSHKKDTSIACFYPVKNCEPIKPITECNFFACFQGSLETHKLRYKVLDAIKQFESYHYEPTRFWTSCPTEERIKLRKTFLEKMNDSQFIFCPRGAGLNSIRFFEAMRMGRIPILIADDTKLPLENMINYENLIVRVPENDIMNARNYVEKWLQTKDIIKASETLTSISLTHFEDIEKFSQTASKYGKKMFCL